MANLHDESLDTTLRDGYNSRYNNWDTSTPAVHKMTPTVECQISKGTDHFQVIFAGHHVAVSVVCSRMVPSCVLCQLIKADIETLNWRVDHSSQDISPSKQTTHRACVGPADTDSGCASCLDIKADINKYILTDMTGDVKVTALRDIGTQELSTVNERHNSVLEIKEEDKGQKTCKLESSEVLECLNKHESLPHVTPSALGAVGPGEALEIPSRDNSLLNVSHRPTFCHKTLEERQEKIFHDQPSDNLPIDEIIATTCIALGLQKQQDICEQGKQYLCEICGRGTSTPEGLTVHQLIHLVETSSGEGEGFETVAHEFITEDDKERRSIIHKKKFTGQCHSVRDLRTSAKQDHIQDNRPKSDLGCHRHTHPSKKTLLSKDCGKGFSTMGRMKGAEVFTRQGHTANHKKTQRREKLDKDDVTGKGFASKYMLLHKRTCTVEKPYPCNVCGNGFADKGGLLRHKSTHTGEKPFTCDVCGKEFPRKEQMVEHKMMHTGEKAYNCNLCGKRFARKSHLVMHTRTHMGEKPYKCDICGKGFAQKSALATHIRTHIEEKPYKCYVCGKGFAQKQNFVGHKRKHTGEKPYKCDVCGKEFTHKQSIIVHNRTHTGEKPYRCEVCGKGFTRKSIFTRHSNTHTGEYPYKCGHCGKGFSLKFNLTIHIRTHTGEKPFKCNVCGQGFALKATLSIHNRIHTGEKPYTCQLCGKKFTQKAHLSSHNEVHLREKRYKCDVCDAGFRQKRSLLQHNKTHRVKKP